MPRWFMRRLPKRQPPKNVLTLSTLRSHLSPPSFRCIHPREIGTAPAHDGLGLEHRSDHQPRRLRGRVDPGWHGVARHRLQRQHNVGSGRGKARRSEQTVAGRRRRVSPPLPPRKPSRQVSRLWFCGFPPHSTTAAAAVCLCRLLVLPIQAHPHASVPRLLPPANLAIPFCPALCARAGSLLASTARTFGRTGTGFTTRSPTASPRSTASTRLFTRPTCRPTSLTT